MIGKVVHKKPQVLLKKQPVDKTPGKFLSKHDAVKKLLDTLAEWKTDATQQRQILGLSITQYEKLVHDKKIPTKNKASLLRMIHINRIKFALQSLFGKNAIESSRWMNSQNKESIFEGKSAIDFICAKEENLFLLSKYLLHHTRSGW